MEPVGYKNEFLVNYMNEFTSRVANETGVPSDKYHLGKLILQGLNDDPDFVLQIDGGTGESETNASVLSRSIQCATSFKNMGLKTGDVMILMAPNHLNQTIPFYAALYLGIAVAPIDRTFGVYELKYTFDINKPKIIFCQSERVQDVHKAVELSGLDAQVISFDQSEHTISFSNMMRKYGQNMDVKDFKATDLDPEETIAFLIATSGTTGLPKSAAITHKNAVINGPPALSFSSKFPSPTRLVMIVSPLQWLSAILNYFVSPLLKYSYLQTSKTVTPEHAIEMIAKYKPTFLIISPTMMITWQKAIDKEQCDLTCFEVIFLGGSAVPNDLVEKLKGYYNNPEATAEAFTKDGWFKTGDMMYRDENWRFYYVERIKLLLKYRNYQISPVELESVIRQHPGVLDVAVTGIPNADCGDLPCACVVPRPGATLTEQEIKDLVKENLSDTKQLRGGVIFLEELPLTTSTKINRQKLKEIVIAHAREQLIILN